MTTVGVDEYAGSRVLARRGWTEAAIRRFLGEPDRRVPNPVYRSAAPARLYSMTRVTAAEDTPEWQAWHLAARQAIRTREGRGGDETRPDHHRGGRPGHPGTCHGPGCARRAGR